MFGVIGFIHLYGKMRGVLWRMTCYPPVSSFQPGEQAAFSLSGMIESTTGLTWARIIVFVLFAYP